MNHALERFGVALAGIVTGGLFGACLPIHQVVVLPTGGQSEAQAAQDRYECYRLAQPGGFEGYGTAGGPGGTAVVAGAAAGAAAGAIGQARGAAAGGVIGGLFAGIIAGEAADARARPADIDRYAECLRARHYEVRVPR